ncbi:MAG: DUF1194 domain-containing protein [Hyphomicrobiaceae bacterium]
MMRLVLTLLAACLASVTISTSKSEARSCELALVLAIDVSGSVDSREFAIQIEGLAAALRSDDVANALAAAGPDGVLATVIHWSGSGQQVQIVPWTRLSNRNSIGTFAGQILQFPRQFDKYSTAIGEALAFANGRFHELPFRCRRRVIDISGDGRNNEGWSPHLIRNQVVRQGITINALAILASEPELMTYFQQHIIGGAGSFVISADRFEDYPAAIKRKLVREILPPIAFEIDAVRGVRKRIN